MEIYDIIYTLGNLFMAYVLHKFMHIFYSDRKVTQATERIAYIGYFLVITATHITENPCHCYGGKSATFISFNTVV